MTRRPGFTERVGEAGGRRMRMADGVEAGPGEPGASMSRSASPCPHGQKVGGVQALTTTQR